MLPRFFCRRHLAFLLGLALPGLAAAQEPPAIGPWIRSVDALVGWQGRSDLDGGGSMASRRAYTSFGLTHADPPRAFMGLRVGIGATVYDFDGADFWENTRELRFSAPLNLSLGPRSRAFIIPSLRFHAEQGADLADGATGGLIAAVTWEIGDTLSLGPGLGVFSQLEDGPTAFPILAIDWAFAPNWRLGTGRGIAASQGPGLSLRYRASDALELALAARIESAEFRLDDRGPAPGGVGRDEAVPVVLSALWSPNPGLEASAFAGMRGGGRVTLYDASGTRLRRSDQDPAPIFGARIAMRF